MAAGVVVAALAPSAAAFASAGAACPVQPLLAQKGVGACVTASVTNGAATCDPMTAGQRTCTITYRVALRVPADACGSFALGWFHASYACTTGGDATFVDTLTHTSLYAATDLVAPPLHASVCAFSHDTEPTFAECLQWVHPPVPLPPA